jgi:hypothetical protein
LLRLVDHFFGALQAIQTSLRVRYGVLDEHIQVFETLFQVSPVPQVGISWVIVAPEVKPDPELLLETFEFAVVSETVALDVVVTF